MKEKNEIVFVYSFFYFFSWLHDKLISFLSCNQENENDINRNKIFLNS